MVAERHYDATTAARRRRSEKEHSNELENSCADEEETTGGPVVVRQQVLVNGRWVTVIGDVAEYIKKLIVIIAQMERKMDLTVASDSLDVALKQEDRTRKVVDECNTVEPAQDWVTDEESMDTQLFEACACEMEMMKVLLMELQDVKSKLLALVHVGFDVEETVEVPHVQFLDPAVNVPVVMERQAPQERLAEATSLFHV